MWSKISRCLRRSRQQRSRKEALQDFELFKLTHPIIKFIDYQLINHQQLHFIFYNQFMNLLALFLLASLLIATTCNSCINKHCKTQQSTCKQDKAELPCTNVINTCLDLCPSNTSYSCIAFCVSSRKNTPANNFLRCCSEFSCKVEKFTAKQQNNQPNLQSQLSLL